MIDTSKRATMATIKAFVKKNRTSLLIDVEGKFDGMTDCVQRCDDRGFSSALVREEHMEHTLGIQGAWFVGSSRDYITPFNKDGLSGYRIYNCTGSFSLAVKCPAD